MKVLLFLDAGGSMDPHIALCEEQFSPAHAEFNPGGSVEAHAR